VYTVCLIFGQMAAHGRQVPAHGNSNPFGRDFPHGNGTGLWIGCGKLSEKCANPLINKGEDIDAEKMCSAC
jgi:hypothetical protein